MDLFALEIIIIGYKMPNRQTLLLQNQSPGLGRTNWRTEREFPDRPERGETNSKMFSEKAQL